MRFRNHPQVLLGRLTVIAILVASLFSVVTLAGPARPAGADTGGLVWPANGFVSWNAHDHKNSAENVYAIDIASFTPNNPVVAAAAGTIVTASSGGNTQCYSVNHASNGLGNYITIQHSSASGTTFTTYAHLASLSVSSGSVAQGQQIGIMGQTGCAGGPHVHFAVSTCASIFTCTEWASPDPSNNTTIARGTAITNSSYPGVSGGGGASAEPQPNTITVVANRDGRLEAFGVNTHLPTSQSNVFHMWQTTPGGSWSGWTLLAPGYLTSIAAGRNADGRLEVVGDNAFVPDGGNNTFHIWQTSPGGSWSGFSLLAPGYIG